MKQKSKISKKMTFSKLIEKYPESVEILLEKGLGCVMCPMSQQETLEQGLKAHGLKVSETIKELEKKLEKKK